jgi:hypothetical protein
VQYRVWVGTFDFLQFMTVASLDRYVGEKSSTVGKTRCYCFLRMQVNRGQSLTRPYRQTFLCRRRHFCHLVSTIDRSTTWNSRHSLVFDVGTMVTRLSEFSPFGLLLKLGIFEITNVHIAHFWATFFQS